MTTPGTPENENPAHVERAVGRHLATVQADLVPDSGHADPQVRVVGQQRFAGGRVTAVDDPAVAAQPVAQTVAQPVALPEQGRHGPDGVIDRSEGRDLTGGVGGSLRIAGLARFGVLLEDAVHDRALSDDRLVCGVRVRRVELVDLALVVVHREQDPRDLVVHVRAQVPRHRLEPGQRVDRCPRFGPVVESAGPQERVLHRDLRGAVCVEVDIDPVGVRLECGAGGRLDQCQLLLRDPAPAHRPDGLVGVQGLLPEQFREPSGRDVAADVHLVEAVLRVHVALGNHQVGSGVGVDLRDAIGVAKHLHRAGQARDRDLAGRLRQRPSDQYHREGGHGHHEQRDAHRDVRRPAGRPGPPPEAVPPVGHRVILRSEPTDHGKPGQGADPARFHEERSDDSETSRVGDPGHDAKDGHGRNDSGLV